MNYFLRASALCSVAVAFSMYLVRLFLYWVVHIIIALTLIGAFSILFIELYPIVKDYLIEKL